MLQKIGFAQSLIHNPELVILDEPVSGLDPDGRYYISELIRDVSREGAAVFFSSHLLHDAEKLCQKLVILKNGQVVFNGPTTELLERMGTSVEISAEVNGAKKTFEGLTPADSQGEIQKLVSQGAQILEVRQVRRSLEEAFIEIAMKRPKL